MQNTINVLRASLVSATDRLGRRLYDERETRQIIDLLLEDECGISRMDRILHPAQELTPGQRERMAAIAARLAEGQPMQQAVGRAWFCGAFFDVTPDVLIPRPETAELVEWIADDCAALPCTDEPLRLLDIGTGSGCIALSLARLINNVHVTAMDLSTAALAVAKGNAEKQGIEHVDFVQKDILRAVENSLQNEAFSTGFQQHWHVIVSNPPYICRKEAAEMSDLVLQHEPDMALFVPDDDPLLFYRAIGRYGLIHLEPQGHLYFEINAAYGPETCQLLQSLGYVDVELRQDVSGRARMVKAARE